MSIFSKIVTKVFGKKSDKDLKILYPVIDQINEKYNKLSSLSDENLKERFNKIKSDLSNLISSNKEKLTSENLNDEDIDSKLYLIEKEFLDSNGRCLCNCKRCSEKISRDKISGNGSKYELGYGAL